MGERRCSASLANYYQVHSQCSSYFLLLLLLYTDAVSVIKFYELPFQMVAAADRFCFVCVFFPSSHLKKVLLLAGSQATPVVVKMTSSSLLTCVIHTKIHFLTATRPPGRVLASFLNGIAPAALWTSVLLPTRLKMYIGIIQKYLLGMPIHFMCV